MLAENLHEYVSNEEIARFLSNIIRVKSVSGNETEVALRCIEVLEKEGIYEYELIESERGRGNLIIELKGSLGEGFNLAIIGHSDVVPAGDNWDIDPFGGVIRDGYIYGRGAIDNKGQVAVMIYLTILLKRTGLPFRGKLKLIIAADEEGQSEDHGMRFLMKNRPDIFKDIDGAIGELGGLTEIFGEKRQMIIFGEKGGASIEVIFKDEGGHSFNPVNYNNPINQAASFIKRLPDKVFYLDRNVIQSLRELLGIRSLILTTSLFSKIVLKIIKKFGAGESKTFYGNVVPLTNITIAKTMVNGGIYPNVLPDKASVTLNVRFFPSNTLKDILNIIEKYLTNKNGAILNLKEYIPSTVSPRRGYLYESILKTVGELGYRPLPIIMPATSDSAWLRTMGIPTYHFFTTRNPLELNRVHGKNERIHLEDLMGALEGYIRLLINLSS